LGGAFLGTFLGAATSIRERFQARKFLWLLALAGLLTFGAAGPAQADCVLNGTLVICSGASPNGFTAGLGQNGLSVNVQSGATVGNGTTNNITLNDNNAVMNFGSITVGAAATGIAAANNNSISNLGAITAGDGGTAVSITGTGSIFNSGSVTVGTAGAIGLSAPSVTNTGTITTSDFGVGVNGTADFGGKRFIFAAEDGTISGWPGAGGDLFNAQLEVDHSSTAIYKGLTLASFNGANYLYAANFHGGVVEAFDTNFAPFSFSATAFKDPQIPSGYAPFNVQAVGNTIVVTFAKQDKDQEDEVAGNGLGFVDIFTTNGMLVMRLQSGPWMNAPWGVVMAPLNFGELSGRLLIGNFGSGLIAAFDAATGSFVSFLKQSPGAPLRINGLWGIGFGNDASAGPSNTLFFAAGDANEHHGLFGTITAK